MAFGEAGRDGTGFDLDGNIDEVDSRLVAAIAAAAAHPRCGGGRLHVFGTHSFVLAAAAPTSADLARVRARGRTYSGRQHWAWSGGPGPVQVRMDYTGPPGMMLEPLSATQDAPAREICEVEYDQAMRYLEEVDFDPSVVLPPFAPQRCALCDAWTAALLLADPADEPA